MTVDLETAITGELVANSVLAGNISTRWPRNYQDRLPYATIQRAPGSRFEDVNTRRLEAVRLIIKTLAGEDHDIDAFEAMAALLDALSDLEGQGFRGVFVTSVDIPQSPQWSPDPDTELPGYLAYVIVHAHVYAPS